MSFSPPRSCRAVALFPLLVAVLLTSVPAAPAAAQSRIRIDRPHQGPRPLQLDVHGGFVWWGLGFATGARFGIPILANGFIPKLNNAVYINFGADLYFVRYRRRGNDLRGVGVGFPVALHWEFYFDDHWSAFGELGANLFLVHPAFVDDGVWYGGDAVAWFIAAVGGRYHVSKNVALTLRVGLPYASFGVTFML